MIGRGGAARGQWAQAAGLSILLHGAALAGIIYEPGPRVVEPDAPSHTEISVEALLPGGTDSGPETAVLQPLPPVAPPDPIGVPANPGTAPIPPSDIVTAIPDSWPVLVQPMAALPPLPSDTVPVQPGNEPDPAPESAPTANPDGPPMDPRLADMITRIRDKLDEACLLALPQQLSDGGLQLAVLAADDRQIGSFIEEVTAGFGAEVPSQNTLVDQRQCPALTFARRTQNYPLFGLTVQLPSQDVDSGSSLVGRIANGAGNYNTLLLVDDNGVVQDLRRFLIVQGGEVTFDIPVARVGAARDTNQLLVAIATEGRIDSVTTNAGRLASDFFPALVAEIGDNALIGVTSVYVR